MSNIRRTVADSPVISIHGFRILSRINVRIDHAEIIDTSAKRDHLIPFPITRSTIVQTAIPEKAIIPVNSQICFRVSVL
jgi:hypothetical protein